VELAEVGAILLYHIGSATVWNHAKMVVVISDWPQRYVYNIRTRDASLRPDVFNWPDVIHISSSSGIEERECAQCLRSLTVFGLCLN